MIVVKYETFKVNSGNTMFIETRTDGKVKLYRYGFRYELKRGEGRVIREQVINDFRFTKPRKKHLIEMY
jgi:hypothetical protein